MATKVPTTRTISETHHSQPKKTVASGARPLVWLTGVRQPGELAVVAQRVVPAHEEVRGEQDQQADDQRPHDPGAWRSARRPPGR